MKKFCFDCGTRETMMSLGLLILRGGFSLMLLIGHGLPKIQTFAEKKAGWHVPDLFPLSWMSPQVSLIATIAAEVGASALLLFGWLTRPAAFVLSFTMVIAAFEVHSSHPWFLGNGVTTAKELALLYLIPFVVILLTGAGGWSVDALVYKGEKRRRW